jgi:hypothetical protein
MKEVEQIIAELANKEHPFEIGRNCYVRTVTMIYTGRLVAVYPTEIVLLDAAWIAETARFADSMKTGEFNEVEPYPDGMLVVVGRGAISDYAAVDWPLPRVQK